MENLNKWQINYDYTETQLNKLVRTGERFSLRITDEYGNKTNYFSINQNQLQTIGKALKNIN